MTLLFAGNNNYAFVGAANTNVINTANDTYSHPYRSPWGATQLGAVTSPVSLGGITEAWMGFTMGNILGSATETQAATMMQLQTSGGQGILRLQNSNLGVRTFDYWTGSAWTTIATVTAADCTTRMGRRFDMRCKIHGSTGSFELYVDRVLVASLTGNTDFFSATIDGFQMNNWGRFNGRAIADVFVATTDTRKLYNYIMVPTGNDQTGWTGGFGNVDENGTNLTTTDTDATVSSAASQTVTFTKAAFAANQTDNRNIVGVAIGSRAKNDGSSADFDHVLRISSTNYTASHNRTISSSYANGFYSLWTVDPSTSGAWSKTAIEALSFGAVSKNAGASSISATHLIVTIEKDGIDQWDDAYPAGVGIGIVETTCPASTGVVDITHADMVTAGIMPKGALIFCTSGQNSATANGRVSIGGICNHRKADHSGKSFLRLSSIDAQNSSSTTTKCQTRSLHDFPTVNGVGPIENLGITADLVEFINGGIRLDFSLVSSGAPIGILFFWGDDVDIDLAIIGLGTGTSQITVTGVGFQPDALVVWGGANTFSSTTDAFGWMGVAERNAGTPQMRTIIRQSDSGVTAGPTPIQEIVNDKIGGFMNTTGSLGWSLTLDSIDSDGYKVTPSASTSNTNLCVFAIKVTGRRMKIIDINTPTSTGVTNHTGAGFEPGTAIGCMSSLQALNTIENDTEKASSISFFAADEDLNEVSAAMSENAASDPSACKNWCGTDHTIRIGSNNSTLNKVVGALQPWDSDGLSVNYTAVDSVANIGFALLIEASANAESSNSHSNDITAKPSRFFFF